MSRNRRKRDPKTLPSELGVVSCKDGETALARQFLAAARQASRAQSRAA